MSAAAEAAPKSDPRVDDKRGASIALLVVSLIGLILGVVLTIQHYTGGELAGCSSTGFFNCDLVNHSIYSEVRSLPVALLGAITYLLTAGLAFTRWRRGPAAAGSAAYAFTLACLAVLLSGFLGWKSKTELGTFCLYCLGLYATNLALFATSWMALGGPAHWLPAMKADWQELGSMRVSD